MTKLNHKQKTTMMRNMLNLQEKDSGVAPYNSLEWRRRKWAIMQRVKRIEIRAKYHSEVRKGLRGQKETAA